METTQNALSLAEWLADAGNPPHQIQSGVALVRVDRVPMSHVAMLWHLSDYQAEGFRGRWVELVRRGHLREESLLMPALICGAITCVAAAVIWLLT